MITPLQKRSLHDLIHQPILFDANVFMAGIEYRSTDSNYSFEKMANLYIRPLMESFTEIYIHEEVYRELDKDARELIDQYVGRNATIVGEGDLYGRDPLYTTIFNNIAGHELVRYQRGASKDRGEVYSLAYAAYHHMNYFSSREIMVDLIARELPDLKDVEILTFDVIMLQAYVYYAERNDHTYSKSLKAMYKRYCADVIKRHKLPPTLGEYIKECQQFL